MLGLGVLINSLKGNEKTMKSLKDSLGKTIENVFLYQDILVFKFTDGYTLRIFDDGQTCCEHRYMDTDDDLSYYKGSKLLDFELKDSYAIDEYGESEVQFLDVITDKGVFQMCNHNEHNGYYGGFWIVAETYINN